MAAYVFQKWDPNKLLIGQNGLAALTFCEVPIVKQDELVAPIPLAVKLAKP